jgi:PAS domain S-box-containing protein
MLSAIVDSSFDAIIGHTMQAAVTSWNRAAEGMFGYKAAEIVGKRMATLFPTDRLHEAEALSKSIGQGEVMRPFDTELMRKDQTAVAVALASDSVAARTKPRVKNTLATVQSITAQTLRAGGASPDMRATLEGRLIALAHAHGVLMERNWKGADLRETVDRRSMPSWGTATTASGSKDRPLTSRRR